MSFQYLISGTMGKGQRKDVKEDILIAQSGSYMEVSQQNILMIVIITAIITYFLG